MYNELFIVKVNVEIESMIFWYLFLVIIYEIKELVYISIHHRLHPKCYSFHFLAATEDSP